MLCRMRLTCGLWLHAPPPERFEGTKLLDRHLGRSDELALWWGMVVDLSAPVVTTTFARLGLLQLLGLFNDKQ